MSWSFDETLFVDLSGRVDKSSMLAPDKRTAGSYGLTALTDLKKALLGNSGLIGRLMLTAGYGTRRVISSTTGSPIRSTATISTIPTSTAG